MNKGSVFRRASWVSGSSIYGLEESKLGFEQHFRESARGLGT